MLEGKARAKRIIDNDRTHAFILEFAADNGGRDLAFLKVRQHIDIEKKPVREHDQTLDAAIKKHLKVSFKTCALVVHVGEDGQIRRVEETVLDSPQYQRAVGIGHIEHHDTDGVAAATAQGTGEEIRAVSELGCGALDARLSRVGNVARQRRVIQDNGNGRRRETAAFGDVANRRRGLRSPTSGRHGGIAGRRFRISRPHGLLEFRALAGGHYSTVNLVSRLGLIPVLAILWLISSLGIVAQATQTTPSASSAAPAANLPALFQHGEASLRAGKLDEAERDFKEVLAADPNVAGAYANLGVIHMRRKQWVQALAALRKAEKLAPNVPGVRLNIGLVYYRQNQFAAAIKPFETVVRDVPDSYQARYLLGFCYFFNERWQETISTLEPIWGQASDQLNYLYVLGRAAEISKHTALEERAYGRMAEVGQGSPQLRLIIGKAHLNRGEYDDALRELQAAAQADPKLPLVHYYLGMTYVRKQENEKAREEFQKDIAAAPDAAYSYEQLGKVETALQNEDGAAKNFRQAVKLDPRLAESRLGLAKILERKKEHAAALAQLDEILRLDKDDAGARYLRGQVLFRMGREKEGREELALATKKLNEQREARHKELEGETVASPELAQEPQ